jgi:hypothetical protein
MVRIVSTSRKVSTEADQAHVPKHLITVGEALAILRSAAVSRGDVRAVRRALLEVLAALDEAE